MLGSGKETEEAI